MNNSWGTSVMWLLSLILAAILVLGLAVVQAVQGVILLLHQQNMLLLQWRQQFAQTFRYVEEDGDVSGMWGNDEDDKGAKSWN